MSKKECILTYDEITDYIKSGYKPLEDLQLLIEHKYITCIDKGIRVYLDHESKIIDVFGGAVTIKQVIVGFGSNRKIDYIYYPTNKLYKT